MIPDFSSTAFKLFVAKLIYRCISLFTGKHKRVRRAGIQYDLDLSEGIDLQVYLTGGFQKHVVANSLLTVPADAVILDIGANTGVMSLNFAKAYPQSTVYAFEPTEKAFGRMKTNLDLNSRLANRIHSFRAFVSAHPAGPEDKEIYSSWPLEGHPERHNIHGGVAMKARNTPTYSIDSFVREQGLDRIDLIKIDTDGHELEVLKGAKETLKAFRPGIILELGAYLTLPDGPNSYIEITELFKNSGYNLFSQKGKPLSKDNFKQHVPQYGTIDAIAIPNR